MTILGAASAFPPYRYPQQTLTTAFKEHWGERLARPALLDRFHSRAGVRQRYLAYPLERYPEIRRWGDANRAWFDAASKLGEQALDRALTRSGLNRQ
jgi:alkylresorcinol/alkylpyrone synthase